MLPDNRENRYISTRLPSSWKVVFFPSITNDNQLYHIANRWELEKTLKTVKNLKGSNIEKMYNATYIVQIKKNVKSD